MHSTITTEKWTNFHVTFQTGNDLRNKILQYGDTLTNTLSNVSRMWQSYMDCSGYAMQKDYINWLFRLGKITQNVSC